MDPFAKFHLLNWICSDFTTDQELSDDRLRGVWTCEWTAEHLETIVRRWIERDTKEHSTASFNNEAEALLLLCDAIELTLIFLQQNFTGPFHQFAELNATTEKLLNSDFNPFERLMENGEEINPNVKLGALLVVAKEMLKELVTAWPQSIVLHWWQLRLLCIHQHILQDLANNLYEQFLNLLEILLTNEPVMFDSNDEIGAILLLELANGYLQFHRTQKCEELLNKFCDRYKIKLNVDGLLGVRTKFQQKPLPQLCLKVEQSENSIFPSSLTTNGHTQLPKLLLLDDDTRLERIRFIDARDNEVMSLPSVLQALVLSKVKLLRRSQPKDRLADEEFEPYLQTLLYQEHGPLQVRQTTLLLNCVQESTQRRTVERSWKQCEAAVKQLNDTKFTMKERLSYAFASFLQPHWRVELQLCEVLLSLGMSKTALDIYLRIQAWDQVIHCYTRLELRHKAAEIIRQELEKRPTAHLHCLLGDATDDPTCYDTAWEFSKQTSGKAQAHWGTYYFQRNEFEKAIPHLEKSVEINPLQEKIWLRLGYAAIMLERWQLAVHAYITYTHLEPLGFESWNNLAKALIKLGDKKRAHKVLSESLKCNYNNWKVWENFMVVAVDTHHFEDALNAYTRLSELRDRFLDLEVLGIVVKAVTDGRPDAKGQTQERLVKKATTLMGQQCVRHGNEWKVWELSALLASTPLVKAQKLVRAFRAFTAKESSWTQNAESTLKALQLCQDVCEYSLKAIDVHSDEETPALINSQLSSARLTAQACTRAIERVEQPSSLEIDVALTSVKQLLAKIQEEMSTES